MGPHYFNLSPIKIDIILNFLAPIKNCNLLINLKHLLLCLIFIPASGQDRAYAREILDTLCSPHFDGRGYYNDGELRAAQFIRGEFEQMGLQPFGEDFLQPFTLSVNTIVGDPQVRLKGKKMAAGVDFLIDPSSPPFSGSESLVWLTKTELMDRESFGRAVGRCRGQFLVVDPALVADEGKEARQLARSMIGFLKFSEEVDAAGIIEVTDKLTFTASQERAVRPHVVVMREKLTREDKKLQLRLESHFDPKHTSQNVIGYLEGEIKDTFVAVVGHYDHLGRMGDAIYFPGANDNASGIAMMLSLAKAYSTGKPRYSMVFMAFGSEEIGLVGSKYYTDHPLFPLSQIKFLVNLDILGTGDEGIQVVNGKQYPEAFEKLVSLNTDRSLLHQVKVRGESCNSDHCFFHAHGVPSFFIYTLGGAGHYHDVYDRSEELPLTEFEDLFVLLQEFIAQL